MHKEDDQSSPTIVGGQPIGKRGGEFGLPHGIEGIVLLAAAEPAFREDFGRDRDVALGRAGISLTDAERAILKTVSDRELFAMAKCARTAPKKGKRALMATAASLAALASLTTSAPKTSADEGGEPSQKPALSQLDSQPVAQESDPIRGIEATSTPTHPVVYGIEPDTPTATAPAVEGIRPDTPTPTHPPVVGIIPDTPTPTQTYPVVGILTETPTPSHPGTPTPTPSHTATPNPADLNKDGSVDHQDLFIFLQQWYKARSQTTVQEESSETGLDGVEQE